MQRRASFFRSLHWAAGLWAATVSLFLVLGRVPGMTAYWRWLFVGLMLWMWMRLVPLATARPMNPLKAAFILGGLASFVLAFFHATEGFVHEALAGVLLFMFIENAVAVTADPYYKAARRERGEC
ncbi:MAG: hypothetical protein GXO37_07060 [Chloroflexi bacterium]|nr:hypothetical protein [Chloroflexota bacterium]